LLAAFEYPLFPPSLDGLVAKFRAALTETDARLHEEFPQFGIKLYSNDPRKSAQDCFAAGVQF
jgi:hypothetical protein